MNPMKVPTKLLLLLLILFTFAEADAQKREIDSLEIVLNEYKTDDIVKVNLINKIARVLNKKDPEKSRSYAEQSRKLSKQLNYPEGEAVSLWITGLSYHLTDKKKAISLFEEALSIARKIGYKAGICQYLLNIGMSKNALGDVEQGEVYLKEASQMAEELRDNNLNALILFNLSQVQTRIGDYTKAIKQLQKLIRIGDEVDSKKMISLAYGQMGYVYFRQASYPIALEYYLHALKINEELKDSTSIFYNLTNIAEIQSDQKNYETAVKTINRAYKLSLEISNPAFISTCLVSMGKIYMAMKDPIAIKYLEKALYTTKDNVFQSITLLIDIGSVYAEQGEYNKAMKSFEKALALAQQTDFKRACSEVWLNMGLLYYKQKQFPSAMECAQKALDLAKDLKVMEIQQDSYKLLSDLYAATGASNKAYQAHVQYKAVSDSIFNEKNIRKIALLESSYEFDKEKQKYEMDKASQALKIENQRLTIFYLILVSLLVLVLAFAIYWSNKLKKKVLQLKIENINQELEMNQKAMAAATLKLVQNSERDANSIKILESVEKNTIEESQKEIRSLIADYKFKSYNSNWEEFEIMFEKINSSFYEKLNKQYPTLTPNERKLCVFLKLNMSNNHISQITFQSEEALKKARLRLRKKLQIERDVNLTAFIQSL